MYRLTMLFVVILSLMACRQDDSENYEPEETNREDGTPYYAHQSPPEFRTPMPPANAEELLYPDDLSYVGAFRLPADVDVFGWEWGGTALAYYGDGDARDDGYVGSLFATGHDQRQYVAEITIPIPLNSRELIALNTAEMIQPFTDIRGDLYATLDFELPRAALAVYDERLVFAWGQHYQEEPTGSHGWTSLDLSNPQPHGAWRIGDYSNYATNDYMFVIPPDWAAEHVEGMRLATGRYRDGGWGGQGPSLFAFDPDRVEGGSLVTFPLLLYDNTFDGSGESRMNNYHHSDEWSGGAWLTTEEQAAVVFVGTKGLGEYWYGFANGVEWPDQAPYPDIPPYPNDDRGWWSTRFEAQIVFYNPDDLAAVAAGELEPDQPQPYASLSIDSVLLGSDEAQRKYRLGGATFDHKHGLLYVMELFADGDRPVVHVWSVGK